MTREEANRAHRALQYEGKVRARDLMLRLRRPSNKLRHVYAPWRRLYGAEWDAANVALRDELKRRHIEIEKQVKP